MKRTAGLFLLAMTACSLHAQLTRPGQKQTGNASFYGEKFRGRRTASGERFNPDSLTCAHRTLPFGSLVRVTNPKTAGTTFVRVNDRGPFVRSRILDLSDSAAKAIGIYRYGVGFVEAELIRLGPAPPEDTLPLSAAAFHVIHFCERTESLRFAFPLPEPGHMLRTLRMIPNRDGRQMWVTE